ncbi:MAG: transglycosylase SLT domain-containing protein [Gammaproteobacteria bacterium]
MRLSILYFLIILLFLGCSTTPPSKPNNICDIYDEKRSWYKASIRTEKRWGIAPEVTMAFIKHESSYVQGAKPERTRIFFGLLPGKRKSTAYGYAQVVDGTWEQYKKATGYRFVSRRDFKDAVDFIGWYNNRSHMKLGIPKNNARLLYLAYHEGQNGYKKGSYRSKPWLLSVSTDVQNTANKYANQFEKCEKRLRSPFYFLLN